MGVSIVKSCGGGWYELSNGQKVRGRKAVEEAMAASTALVRADSAAAPSLAGRMNFIKSAGWQYRGARDIYGTAGYVAEGDETPDRYWSLYERNPVAGRVVDMPPKTTWRTPPAVYEGEEKGETDDTTDFERAWEEMAQRLRVWYHFENVDRLSRLGRYAVMLIGVRTGEDKALETPLEKISGPEDVIYLSSYSERYADIKTWDQEPESPRFGLPETYELELSSGVAKFKSKKVIVHWSRLIHVAEDTLTDEVFGRPALKRVLNALDDLLKVTASTGEAYWQLAARILTGNIDPAANVPKDMLTELGEAMEEMVHDLRRQVLGQGLDLSWLSGETPKPAEALEVYKQLMSVGSGIPTRILFGSEQGQLASSQDERAYFGTINERQEHHAEPNILRALIDRLVEYNGLPAPGADGYVVSWLPLFELSEKEVAETSLIRAQTAKALTPLGGDPREIVEVDNDGHVMLVSQEPKEPTPVVIDGTGDAGGGDDGGGGDE